MTTRERIESIKQEQIIFMIIGVFLYLASMSMNNLPGQFLGLGVMFIMMMERYYDKCIRKW